MKKLWVFVGSVASVSVLSALLIRRIRRDRAKEKAKNDAARSLKSKKALDEARKRALRNSEQTRNSESPMSPAVSAPALLHEGQRQQSAHAQHAAPTRQPPRDRRPLHHFKNSKSTHDILPQVVDIGGVLGCDIGGTLCKLVYFEKSLAPPGHPVDPEEPPDRHRHSIFHRDLLEQKVAMKRSLSLGDMHDTREKQEALEQFYTFMDHAHKEGTGGVRDEHLKYYSHALGGQLHFFRFETRHMDKAIALIGSSTVHNTIKALGCTGGGAYKFEKFFQESLGVKMLQMDELGCLVRGMMFLIANISGECYTYQPSSKPERSVSGPSAMRHEAPSDADGPEDTFRNMRMRQMSEMREKVDYNVKVRKGKASLAACFPALVVSIGSGVSILKVDGPSKFERVSGSSIGGGTYWGLCRLLTGATDYDESLDKAATGDSDLVDMLVGDIYGRGYNKFQLSSNTLASSFGRIVTKEEPRDGVENEDLAKALIIMITMNIGQVAYLNAKLYDTRRIFFVGNFLRNNDIAAKRLAFAIDYWSSGEKEALFFEHEGYLGALGAFLKSGTDDSDDE